jgi:hypothetical protein
MMRVLLALGLCGLAACGSTQKGAAGPEQVATALGQDIRGSGGERCNGGVAGREVSEYDTSGDGKPDVRKVYMSLGSGVETRLVMICRELDVNADGRKDVIRYYDDEGRTLREESDRDFDGKMDLALVFQEGRIQRKETDDDRDGDIDSKIFYEDGKPLRIERDLSGRSTAAQWNPDRWEYYEDGRLVRMGTDLDGDTRVDRWDRDASLEEEGPSPEAQAAADTASAAASDAESEAQP